MLRLFLLAVGLLTLIALIWHIGPTRIFTVAEGLGPLALLVMFLPSGLMYTLDTLGWRFTLGRHAGAISFGRLLAIRTAGEVVNMTTPTAYVGGEPLKAYLLKRYGVPLVEGMASVVTAKTTMTLAQAAFILMGIGLSVWIMRQQGATAESGGSMHVRMVAAAVTGALLLFSVTLLVVMQRRGLFMGLLNLLQRYRIRLSFLQSRQAELHALDQTIMSFYSHARGAFFLSAGAFFMGWLAEGLEVYVILLYLAPPTDLLTSMTIAAFAVLIKGGTFFVPGSIGAQEGGYLLLLMAYGYSDLAGIAFAILRRLRELVWIAIGLVCMAVVGRFKDAAASTCETQAEESRR
ncbi:MAG: flippase-like domain-containing protein [Nitrospiraceae bacterium]|nr:flippase-like domain-containing protein [Nitrospiraceae bacterium]